MFAGDLLRLTGLVIDFDCRGVASHTWLLDCNCSCFWLLQIINLGILTLFYLILLGSTNLRSLIIALDSRERVSFQH